MLVCSGIGKMVCVTGEGGESPGGEVSVNRRSQLDQRHSDLLSESFLSLLAPTVDACEFWRTEMRKPRVLRLDYNASCQGTGRDGEEEGEMPLHLTRAEEMVAEVKAELLVGMTDGFVSPQLSLKISVWKPLP
ncbi:Sushi Domain-Containing Protein 1 [Manis pentadactyla]|nr:Sushi Domain-Containing Protein 1 [Manis pentadactyla]